jgi:multiple sugar transport system permease protein
MRHVGRHSVARLGGPPSRRAELRRRLAGVGDTRAGDYLLVVPALALVALAFLYPLAFTVDTSFHDVRIGNVVSGGAPWVGLDNWRETLADTRFQHALMVSAIYSVASIGIAFVIAFALALLLAERFPGSGTMRALLLLGWVLPTVVSANVWRWMLDGEYGVLNFVLEKVGLIDGPTFWLTDPATALIGAILVTVWITVPFDLVLLIAGLQGIPAQLHEAAASDGATAWQRLRHITLPLMRPVSLVVVLLSFIYTFRTFDNVYVLTRGGPGDATSIVPIYAYQESFRFFRFGEGAVATTVLLVISLVLCLGYFGLSRGERTA